MKQRLLLLALIASLCIGVRAEQFETLIVKLKDGSETAFFLKDKPQVKFEGTNLKVSSQAGDTTFPLGNVLRFTYALRDASGINETVDRKTGLQFKDNVLVISQIKAGSFVGVYSIDGKLLHQLTPHHTGTYRLNLSELPSGLYIVKANNMTYKITKP
ncbi:MAG: T9SS type A sorting domain-containing protein [Prevotella sp.]|nr:T9SS type A sorting domain-containing protein [Prevotella sp.]